MIIRNRGLISRRQVTKRPKSGIPQKDSSIYLNLQVLHARKNTLKNSARIWESKLAEIRYELQIVENEILEIETYIKGHPEDNGGVTKGSMPMDTINAKETGNIQIVELEY